MKRMQEKLIINNKKKRNIDSPFHKITIQTFNCRDYLFLMTYIIEFFFFLILNRLVNVNRTK